MQTNPLNIDIELAKKIAYQPWYDKKKHIENLPHTSRGRKHLRLAKHYLCDGAPFGRYGRLLRALYHIVISLCCKHP